MNVIWIVKRETIRIAKKFNMDIEESKDLMKEYVIQIKKLDEQNKEMYIKHHLINTLSYYHKKRTDWETSKKE